LTLLFMFLKSTFFGLKENMADDNNLDKLWFDTIEKKEANKHSNCPDFRKEAIFSATLNRLSLEMVTRAESRSSSLYPTNNLFDSESIPMEESVNQEGFSESVPPLPQISLSDLNALSESLHDGNKYGVEQIVKFSDASSTNTHPPEKQQAHSSCELPDICLLPSPRSMSSPKRKRDDDVTSKITEGLVKRRRTKLNFDSSIKEKPSNSEVSLTQKCLTKSNHSTTKDNECYDHIETLSTAKSTTILMPVKSMVNSISELNLGARSSISDDMSWCPNTSSSQDCNVSIDLNTTFVNLKKITS